MKETLFSKTLKYALYAALVVGVILTVTLPFMLDTYARIIHGAVSLTPAYRGFIMPFLMIVAVPCLWIVVEMILMLRTIPTGPFVMRNVKALYRLGTLLFILSAIFIAKCFIFITFLTLFCAFMFVGSGLFAFTFAALIRQAIVFREENDLTI
ncbi:MAG: DUF2975 domain-containing protein [Defluviitaleaceae bacterium]|nr:DUF2975 domain-containing protein [Defluviitaleaceae bacterium]